MSTLKKIQPDTTLALLCLGALTLSHPTLAEPGPCAGSRFQGAGLWVEEIALAVEPGLELRGRRAGFDIAAGFFLKEENHEVDPDPLRFDPDPRSLISVIDVTGEDEYGQTLLPVRIVLLPDEEPALGFVGKEENHEVDPDPLRATSGASLWQARIHFPGISRPEDSRIDRRISFRVLGSFLEPSSETDWHDAFLVWIAVWLWPEAFAGEVTRPHDERFQLVTYGPLDIGGRSKKLDAQ